MYSIKLQVKSYTIEQKANHKVNLISFVNVVDLVQQNDNDDDEADQNDDDRVWLM